MKVKKELALKLLEDLVLDYLYYDREGDEDLSLDDMNKLLDSGVLKWEEIVRKFNSEVKKAILGRSFKE